MERREEAEGVGGRGGETGTRKESRGAGELPFLPPSLSLSLPPSPESRDQLAARTAASDPPIARAFITCLGPGSLPSPPPLPIAVQRGPPGAGGRPPPPGSGPNPPDRLRPAATAPPAWAAAASPAPSRPPRCGPPGLPGERIPALTSRRRDPAPPRRQERLHSRDARSAPAPPAASSPRGALSSLRPAAPERCRPPQSRPASPLPPQRSRLSNGGRRASPALAWLTESLSPPNFTSAASLPSPLPPARRRGSARARRASCACAGKRLFLLPLDSLGSLGERAPPAGFASSRAPVLRPASPFPFPLPRLERVRAPGAALVPRWPHG